MKIRVITFCLLMALMSIGYATSDRYVKYTHSGDDGTSGICTGYVLKQALTADSLTNNWDDCKIVGDTIWNTELKPAGTLDSVLVPFSAYGDGNYFFGIKAFDEVKNTSLISNIPNFEIDNTPPAPVNCSF